MKLFSTNNPALEVDLKRAVIEGLPPDNGLYMPTYIPVLPVSFWAKAAGMSFQELAFEVTNTLLNGAIPEEALQSIIQQAVSFDAPLVEIEEGVSSLELWHGPTLAFKDFGARFMAQLMGYFVKDDEEELHILVATSGDTGGAVAAGFYNTPGIRVTILYPSGKVSPLQEKQLTTLGANISALEVNGTFDDCQALVKKAFLDPELKAKLNLSSANSINIARLIPQTFYYFRAWQQIQDTSRPLVMCVPSGNFGNLTAGLIAKRMGLPVSHFIAATNANDVVPAYLETGAYNPRPSVPTISNAMDVGAPSNFARMQDLYAGNWEEIKRDITGFCFDDEQTKQALKAVYEGAGYLMDPHGAVGYLALKAYQNNHPNTNGIILETAHPAKFLEVVEPILNRKIEIPERLASLANKTKVATYLENDYLDLKQYLLGKSS
ncbi:MAG: threonine synthase [Bacteroidia bacterium]